MKKSTEDMNHHDLVKESYQDKGIAKKYDGLRFNGIFGDLSNKRDINMILGSIGDQFSGEKISVLDVACGTGRITEALVSRYPSIMGCDGSQEMIDVAKEKEALSGVGFRIADATDLPFESSSFDCVVSVRFIGHLNEEDCQLAMNEMSRVARKLVVLDVCIDNPIKNFRRAIKSKIQGSYLEFDTEWSWRTFTEDSLRVCLEKAGLKLVSKKSKLPFWSDAFVISCVPLKA